jgi:hypothetical protein
VSTSPPVPPPPPEEAADVLFKSYSEVLLFLKHQDDKINRVLTTLAFLTAAGVALYVFSQNENPARKVRFGHESISLTTFTFLLFLTSLFFALIAALAALDPTSQYPRFLPRAERSGSILHYRAIAKGTDWPNTPQASYSDLAESAYQDARVLAIRAVHKTERFAESRAFVHVAMASLALLGIFSVPDVSLRFRWWLCATFLATILIIPAWQFWAMWRMGFDNIGRDLPSDERALPTRKLLGAAWPYFITAVGAAVFLLVARPLHAEWSALIYSLAVLLTNRLVLQTSRRGVLYFVSIALFIGGLAAVFVGVCVK